LIRWRVWRVERVVAYYAGEFPEDKRAYAAVMRRLAEYPAATEVTAGLEAVPFNCFGFGLFPAGRVGDPDTPCLSLWYDDPHPIYCVQVRRRWDRDILTCDDTFSPARRGRPRWSECHCCSLRPDGHRTAERGCRRSGWG